MSKCVVPVSGGIDSTVILHWVASEGHEVHAVSFNYGQRHFERRTYTRLSPAQSHHHFMSDTAHNAWCTVHKWQPGVQDSEGLWVLR